MKLQTFQFPKTRSSIYTVEGYSELIPFHLFSFLFLPTGSENPFSFGVATAFHCE